jgi:hypothetical protein
MVCVIATQDWHHAIEAIHNPYFHVINLILQVRLINPFVHVTNLSLQVILINPFFHVTYLRFEVRRLLE